MVIDALLRTVADSLRTSLSVNENYIRVMPDALPIPSMGKWFISIFGGKFRKVHDDSTCIRGSFTFNLTMTFRHSGVPRDRQGTDLTALVTTGTIAIFEDALKSLDNNTTIVTTANTAIGYTGIESAPLLEIPIDFKAKPIRGGGTLGWLNAANNERAGFIFEASFKTHIYIQRA
jgi:hypothetical protein